MIEIKNLQKVYPSRQGETVALKDINLTIEDGDIYGIIGLSGAGKSTLVRCINLLERPTSGEILIDGEDLTKASKKRLLEIRRKVSMIFQHFNLLQQRTVLKNVELAGEIAKIENPTERAKELLEIVGLQDKLSSYPSELSGGQQQRVAIARALMSSPKILLCDEATSALDPETTHSILELLKSLNKRLGLTVVIISHQMSVIEAICNKVAIISNSKIVSNGYLEDVFLSPTDEVAKKLIYSGHISTGIKDEKYIKLMFSAEVDKPIVADLIKNLGVSLSIMYGETKMIGDRVCGQVIFKLLNYEKDIESVKNYLTSQKVPFEEVDSNALY